MRRKARKILIGVGITFLLTACVTTTVPGKNNEEYSEKTMVTEQVPTPVHKPASKLTLQNPKAAAEIPVYYSKFRLPGIPTILYGFTNENGTTDFRVYAMNSGTMETGFVSVDIQRKGEMPIYLMRIDKEEFIDPKDDKPGTPLKLDSETNLSKLKDHWLQTPDIENMYCFRAKNGEYQFRRWARSGEYNHFYPANNMGVMILGGLPDAVLVEEKWVEIRILNPMTFPYEIPEEDTETRVPEEIEIIETEPDTETETWIPPDTEPEWIEPERTEPEQTEPVWTEPPETEPEVTEPEITEPPETEPPVTESPSTEDPDSEGDSVEDGFLVPFSGHENDFASWGFRKTF